MDTKIQTISILRDFHNITKARVSIYDLDYNEVAGYPSDISTFCKRMQKNKATRSLCIEADKNAFEMVKQTEEAYTYTCHCGLVETVAPIYHYGVLSGYFMIGQIRSDDAASLENIKKLSSSYCSSTLEVDEICKTIPCINKEMISSYINILKILAEYLTHTHQLAPRKKDLAVAVKQYIHKNISSDITIASMCNTFECSRTTLMNNFKKKYGVTIGEYVTKYRLSLAETLLRTSKKSIKLVSLECGFGDQNYFSKVFYKEHSLTPSEYRKINLK